LLGDYAKQAAPELLVTRRGDRHPTELADLLGARLVVSTEVDDGKRLAENLVKQMTGGDTMKGRFMGKDFFEWVPTHKLFLAANYRPAIRGTDNAIWRRIHLVPFSVTIPPEERDGRLPAPLRSEMSGILNWAIAGCLEWQANGLGVPRAVKEATANYRVEQDLLAEFLEEACVEDPGAWVAASSLFSKYIDWARDRAERAIGSAAFAAQLSERGFHPERRTVDGKQVRGRLGLKLRGWFNQLT
jgi:putative DNA primase/helicase